jgi:3'-phosphoadenosine 5'-phosphosulfate sulfotransferase (PAPS reductase)/FAD synthetase
MDEKSAMLYAELKGFKYLVAKTQDFIEDCFSKVKNPYVACSFGKDSAVMLDLILKVNADVDIVFVARKETKLVDDYEKVMNEWNLGRLIVVDFEGCTFDYISKSVIKEGMSKIEKNYDGFFVGLRAQESVGRRITLKKDGLFYQNKSGLVRMCPVGFWSEKDIVAYCVSRRLPTLSTYLKEGFSSRTTAGISSKTPEVSLASLKNRDINAFNRLLELMPEAKFYV